MKRYVAPFAVLVMALGLAACSEPATGESSVPAPAPPAPTASVDTSAPVADAPAKEISPSVTSTPPAPEKEVEKRLEKTEIPKPPDEVKMYYAQGGVSVEISHAADREMIYRLHDRSGTITYVLKSEHKGGGMSSSVKLSYRPDGSVSRAKVTESPGASRYWYETDIHFDESNVPTYKTRTQMPAESLEDMNPLPWLWDARKGDWVKQEVVEEQPVPDNH